MPAHVNIGGVWKQINAIYVRTGGVWKEVSDGYVNVSGVWKSFHSGVSPFTTEWKSAGAGANVNAGGIDWQNPGNITASDNTYASFFSGAQTGTETSDILRATNFGFTTSDIPSGATILGIDVGIERHMDDTGPTTDNTVRLRTSSGQTGDNKADTGTEWPDTDTEVIYGGASDDWNAGLSDSDIRGSDFGVDLQVDYQPYTDAPSVDHIRIRIHGEG